MRLADESDSQTYGLIGPGVEMADILAFNLTQTDGHAPRKMNSPDLSTKLKLMGVDVASFGDYFADERAFKAQQAEAAARAAEEALKTASNGEEQGGVAIASFKPSRKRPRSNRNDPIKCLTYHDPISSTYRKYIFSVAPDAVHLLGGIVSPGSDPHVLVRSAPHRASYSREQSFLSR